MNFVLAIEPDASQAGPLTALVRRTLGANLTIVASTQAAIVAMNQRVPDVLLFGGGVPPAERDQAAAHLASLAGPGGVRTLQLANLGHRAAQEKAALDIRMCLAAAEKERVRAMATVIGSAHDESELAGWNAFLPESPEQGTPAPAAVDQSHLQAEIDRRVKREVERLRREGDERVALELRRLRQDAVAQKTVQPETSDGRARPSARAVRWGTATIVASVALVIGLCLLWLPNPVSTAARNSTHFAATAQNAAKVVAQQAITGAPEVTRDALAAAKSVLPHVDVVKSAATPAPRPAPIPDQPPTTITGPGFLSAFSRIPMAIYVDGKRIGSTEDRQLLIASGTHQIEFVSERFRYRAVASLTIPPGHVLPYTVALPSADVRVRTMPGAEVWIEGERVGVAPLEPIHVPIGTREIVVKGADGTAARQVVEVKLGETVEVSLTATAVTGISAPVTPRLAPLSR
jgi:hypothetical protein